MNIVKFMKFSKLRTKLPTFFLKKQELFRETVKNGKDSKTIKYKEHVYISKHKT